MTNAIQVRRPFSPDPADLEAWRLALYSQAERANGVARAGLLDKLDCDWALAAMLDLAAARLPFDLINLSVWGRLSPGEYWRKPVAASGIVVQGGHATIRRTLAPPQNVQQPARRRATVWANDLATADVARLAARGWAPLGVWYRDRGGQLVPPDKAPHHSLLFGLEDDGAGGTFAGGLASP